MKKLEINNFKEYVYYEKLSSGLEVFLVPNTNKTNYFISFGTKYGNSNIMFKVNGKKYQVPSGIAHFLEHKLFEKKDQASPFDFYSKSGTDVNAGTSIFYTHYYCTGNNEYKKNLKYLLNWITKLDITDKQVEKEKGIILQEANIGKDNPDRVLREKLMHNVFVNDPYRLKVIGEDNDIKKITKKDLILCYNSFYRPDNMFVIVSGNFDKDETIKIVRKELKDFKNNNDIIEKIKVEENNNVLKEYEECYLNVTVPKIGMCYKMSINSFNKDLYDLDLYFSMILSLVFGNSSVFYEQGLKKDLFYTFNSYIELVNNYICISIYAISNYPDKLIKEVHKELKDINISKEDFERMKKNWISHEVRASESISVIANSILNDLIYFNKYENQVIERIKKLEYSDLLQIINNINLENNSVIKILPKPID